MPTFHTCQTHANHKQFNRIFNVNNPFLLISYHTNTFCTYASHWKLLLQLCITIRYIFLLYMFFFALCWCFFYQSTSLSISSSLSFVTQFHLIGFHHKFPIMLLHFISLEFCINILYIPPIFAFIFHFIFFLLSFFHHSCWKRKYITMTKLHRSFDRYLVWHKYLTCLPFDAIARSNGCHY